MTTDENDVNVYHHHQQQQQTANQKMPAPNPSTHHTNRLQPKSIDTTRQAVFTKCSKEVVERKRKELFKFFLSSIRVRKREIKDKRKKIEEEEKENEQLDLSPAKTTAANE